MPHFTTRNVAALVAVAVVSTLTGCGTSDGSIDPFGQESGSRLGRQALVDSTGIIHNLTVNDLDTSGTLTATYPTTTALANHLVGRASKFVGGLTGIDSSALAEVWLRDSVKQMFIGGYFDSQSSLSDWKSRTMSHPAFGSYITTQEYNVISTAWDAYDFDPTGMSRSEVCDTVIARVQLLIDESDTLTWAEDEGDGALGMLSVIKGSAELWRNDGGLGGGGEVFTVLQADCLGYLTGWIAAVWDDAHSPGGVQRSGERRRIGQGVIWGGSASGGARWLI